VPSTLAGVCVYVYVCVCVCVYATPTFTPTCTPTTQQGRAGLPCTLRRAIPAAIQCIQNPWWFRSCCMLTPSYFRCCMLTPSYFDAHTILLSMLTRWYLEDTPLHALRGACRMCSLTKECVLSLRRVEDKPVHALRGAKYAGLHGRDRRSQESRCSPRTQERMAPLRCYVKAP